MEQRTEKRPQLSDFRETGHIEQDLDIALLVWRPDFYNEHDRPNTSELIVAKHRDGATGSVWAGFQREHTLFSNLEQHRIPDEVTF